MTFSLVFSIVTDLEVLGPNKIVDLHYLNSHVAPRIAADWYDVGLLLHIPQHKLDAMKKLGDPVGSKCKELFKMWLTQSSDHATWRNLLNAMKAIDLIKAAEELEEDLRKSKMI